MDPPSYMYARYWDWIKPWVESEVEANTRNSNIPAYAAELELSINVFSMIEQVDREEKEAGNYIHQKGEVIEYPEEDGGPRPYVMWELKQAEIFQKKEDEQNGLCVLLNKAICSVSYSLPTGEGNISLIDAFRSGYPYAQGGQGSDSNTGHVVRQRAFGRGRR